MEKNNTAINLLVKIIIDGYKESNNLIGSDGWTIPIELKWEIEKFLEKMDE